MKEISLEEFIKKTGIEDVMAAAFYYAFFKHSGLSLEKWLSEEN